MIRTGPILLILTVLGGKGFGASFDCKRDGLSKIEDTICAHSELSKLDSQLGSVYAVARATAGTGNKDALLKAQKTWLATRNHCSSAQCLHAAYDDRIAQLLSSPNVRGIDFELLLKAGPHGWEPQCPEIPLPYWGSAHVEPTELPQAFAEFISFVSRGSKVLDLRCADIKGDGSITYLLVTREPYGFPGVLTLLSRSRDGSLRKETDNGSIIQTDAAGMAGGYEGIVIHPKGFTVENTFGSAGAESSLKFTVRYSTTARTWMLESIDIDSYSDGDVPPDSHRHFTTANFGHVPFGTFDATPYGIALP
jgi:uncharacterized protein YecT (DUF1311 family)